MLQNFRFYKDYKGQRTMHDEKITGSLQAQMHSCEDSMHGLALGFECLQVLTGEIQ